MLDFFKNINSFFISASPTLTVVGFGFTVWTLYNTLRIEKQVNSKLDMMELSDNLTQVIKQIDYFYSIIRNNDFKLSDDHLIFDIKDFLKQIKTSYSNLNWKTRFTINKSIRLLNRTNKTTLSRNEVQELLGNLTIIRYSLPKEVRP